MNDNPAACSATWLASEIIPASATTVTSVSWWAALNALITGSMVAVSALLPSKASTVSGNPRGVGEQPDRDLRVQAAFLGESGLAEPVTGIGFEVQRGHVVEHQATPDPTRHEQHMLSKVLAGSRVWRTPAVGGSASDTTAAATPVSSSTRSESALLVGSMIRANTNWRNTSSPPAAASNPSTS